MSIVNRPAQGVPLVFRYDSDRARLGLRVTYITHTVVENPAIMLEMCDLLHDDGTRVNLLREAQVGLATPNAFLHEYEEAYTRQFRQVPGLTAEFTALDCVPSDKSFRFRIKGQLRSGGTVLEEIEQSLSERPEGEKRARVLWSWIVLSKW